MKDENKRPDFEEFLRRMDEENDCMKISNRERIIVSSFVVILLIVFVWVLYKNFG